MSETTNEPEQPVDTQLDPADFGPETIDGQRPAGTDAQTPSDAAEPGDPELDADPEDEPSS